MRIAIGVEGTRGDVYPMLALGEQLVARGHSVLIASPPDFAEQVTSRGIDFRPVGPSVRDWLRAQARAVHDGPLATLKAAREFFVESIPRQFEVLGEAALGADLVLGAGTHLAGASVAELYGVPFRYVAYCPMLLPSREHASLLAPQLRVPGWANRVLWWMSERVIEVMLSGVYGHGRERLGLSRVRDLIGHAMGEKVLLAADSDLAPVPKDAPVDVEVIGCLHPFTPEPLPEKLEAFIDAGEPPVYIGFGSMTDPDAGRSTSTLLEAVRLAGLRAVISEGWAGLGDAPLPDDVMVIGPVSHAALFRRMLAVVHHGGAGTTTTAARAGVPQLLVPHLLDQYYWARRVEMAGVSPPAIRRNRLTAAGLATALHAIHGNEWLAERAAALGETLRSAIQARGDVSRVIA